MENTTKKCPMCAEQIPLEATICEYCGAQFKVTSAGYCPNCHQIREIDGNGCCKVCNGEIIDRRVESKLVEEPERESIPMHGSALRKTNRKLLSWGILAGVLLISSIGAFLLLRRNAPPAAPVLIDTPTPIATPTFLPTSAPTISPTLASTQTPRPTPMPTADQRILNPSNQHLYLYVRNLKTWHEARDYCASQGGHLATIQAPSENKFVYDLATENTRVGTWLGATDETQEGTWVWVTGEPWSYWNWKQDPPYSQPNDKAGGEIQPNADFLAFDFWDKTWMDWNEASWFFICEWES